MIQQWEYSSRPSREDGGTRDVSNVKSALARGTIRGCLGVPFLCISKKIDEFISEQNHWVLTCQFMNMFIRVAHLGHGNWHIS